MKKILHRIAHWFGWNTGRVETWYDEREVLMVGFRCDTCGELSGVGICYTQTTGTDPMRHGDEK